MKLKTKLTREEVLKKISSVTVINNHSLSPGQKFKGTISDNSFRIQLMIHSSGNDRIRPEISGAIKEQYNGSEVHMIFRWPGGWKEMGVFILLLNILIACLIAFLPGIPAGVSSMWWVPLIFLALTGGIFYATFRARVYESGQILKKLLLAEE